jgi:hypothetical protein
VQGIQFTVQDFAKSYLKFLLLMVSGLEFLDFAFELLDYFVCF